MGEVVLAALGLLLSASMTGFAIMVFATVLSDRDGPKQRGLLAVLCAWVPLLGLWWTFSNARGFVSLLRRR